MTVSGWKHDSDGVEEGGFSTLITLEYLNGCTVTKLCTESMELWQGSKPLILEAFWFSVSPVFGSISFNQSVPLLISQNCQLSCENVAFNFKYITLMKD